MKKTYISILIITAFFALPSLADSADTHMAKVPTNMAASFSPDGVASGNFCSVSGVNVCVLTQSHEDCLKLGGQKVKSCEQMMETSKTTEHSDHDDSCMVNEDSQEPVYCYGF